MQLIDYSLLLYIKWVINRIFNYNLITINQNFMDKYYMTHYISNQYKIN